MRYLISVALLLGSVGTTTAEPATKRDREVIVGWAKRFFADPYSLRSTEISDRTEVNGVLVLCIGYNGKNEYGAYVGEDRQPFEVTPAGLIPGQSSRRVDTGTCYQPQIRMRPFPELAAIR